MATPTPLAADGYHVAQTRLENTGFRHPSLIEHALKNRAPGDPGSSDVDPGDGWIPQSLSDLSKEDLAAILANPKLLEAITRSSKTIHRSLAVSDEAAQAALAENINMACKLADLETHLSAERSAAQAQLLSTHAIERQWRQKQADLDTALSPFSPTSLYQRVCQGVQEQALICNALEESFLDSGDGEAPASERETGDWIRRYREARTLYYLRQERKERWDEGRVGGWR